ncbi:MAG TPA: HD domain-containing protein [Thermomicrobiales bacterium]|nr:HD domain-containing protein [Thermomicrobiales bacterium]
MPDAYPRRAMSATADDDIIEDAAPAAAGDPLLVPVGVEPRYGKTEIDPESAARAARTEPSLDFGTVRNDPEVQAFIHQANINLGVLGFTEHGFRHVNLVASIARNVMRLLDFDLRHQELAATAGYLHDIGNVVSRHGHASTGATLAHPILLRLGMVPEDIAVTIGAIGSHGDDGSRLGEPVHPVSAALILADKSDVHRSRVRNEDPASFDQHDRVNFAATSSFLRVNAQAKTITLQLTIDSEMASVMEYFEIFLPRMLMSRHAAELLGCAFHISMNEVVVL